MTAFAASDVLLDVDRQLRSGEPLATPACLGFRPLDAQLGGGLARGDLVLLAGSQGVGKTTFALQAARNVAAAGKPVTYVCFEHEPHDLLERLVVLEANLVAGPAAPTYKELDDRLRRSGAGALGDRLDGLPGTSAALERLQEYGARLRLASARADTTTVDEIAAAAEWHDSAGLVVVDYVQKVHVPGATDEETRVSRAASGLKDLALRTGQAVLGISALDRPGLEATRARARHLKGSVTLAYEADVILLLHHKFDVVARQHLVYDLAAGQEHHHWVVLSIDKNRHGDDNVDLAFRKRLSRSHFEPDGKIESDALVDERLYRDR